MRTHHAPPPPVPRPPPLTPPDLHDAVATELIDSVPLSLGHGVNSVTYCNLCGAEILAGETLYRSPPHHRRTWQLCYRCGWAILVHRGCEDPASGDMPPPFMG